MKGFSFGLLREAYDRIKTQGVSMRRRFSISLIAILAAVVALLFLLLNLFGVLNPVDNAIDRALTQQLDHSIKEIDKDVEELAAHAVEFSEQISAQIQKTQRKGLSFASLKNNKDALASFQSDAYDIVYNNIQLADCSGAFYFLNTTVNDSLENTYYNGIYLKYINLNAETTIRNEICLFRGNSLVANENGINLHSCWEFEMEAGVFPQIEELINSKETNPSKAWLMTTVYKLPGTFEYARFLCTPICDGDGNIIGACGFEISDLYFKLSNQTSDSEQEYVLCAFLTADGEIYAGQLSGNRSGYMPSVYGDFVISDSGKFSKIMGEETFIGKTQEIRLGVSAHTIAVLLPNDYYDAYVRDGQIKISGLLVLVAVLAVAASIWMSHYYVRPILNAMEQIKTSNTDNFVTRIPEINDLFEFLAVKDKEHRDEVERLHGEKTAVETQYEQAQTYITHLADERMPEVDENDFEMFLKHLHTLTPKEREIFDYYLAGKKAKEIMEITGINQNTLKYHNKNIYSKLGVSSRKQLLEYAALMKYRK